VRSWVKHDRRAHKRYAAYCSPPTQFIRTLVAARLAADLMGVSTLLVARTDADSAKLLTSDIDPQDHQREVGTGYFDRITDLIAGGAASTKALEGSTEAAQF
jgi:isocitrate lyase